SIRQRRHVSRYGLAGPAPAWAGRGAVEPVHRRADPSRVRRGRLGGARGPLVRGGPRPRQAWIPARTQHPRPPTGVSVQQADRLTPPLTFLTICGVWANDF